MGAIALAKYPNAEFIKQGLFSSEHLIWYDRKEGFFVTGKNGCKFGDNKPAVTQSQLDKAGRC